MGLAKVIVEGGAISFGGMTFAPGVTEVDEAALRDAAGKVNAAWLDALSKSGRIRFELAKQVAAPTEPDPGDELPPPKRPRGRPRKKKESTD